MTFVKQFNQTADILTERLRSFADGKTCIELFPELNHATLDAIGEVGFSYFLDYAVVGFFRYFFLTVKYLLQIK